MSVHDCEAALQETAVELRPLLYSWGFEFHFDQISRGHQAFATGLFVRGELKIGLIYRETSSAAIKLGSVNYQNDMTNASHDQLMSWLGFAAQQRLRYDQETFTSVATDGGSVIDALRADLLTLNSVLGDQTMLAQAIGEARRKADDATQEAAALQAAKREVWLRHRRGDTE